MKTSFWLSLLLLLTLAACSSQSEHGASGGVAASVNGVDITKRQVDYLYESKGVAAQSPQLSASMKRRILAGLVRMELLAQHAKEMRLDKSANYAIERYLADKKILASFAERQLVKKQLSITDEQVGAFVQNNPSLFARRKFYVFDEALISSGDRTMLQELDGMIEKGASLAQLLDELKTRGVAFSARRTAQTTEHLSSTVRNVLGALKSDVPQLVAFDKSKVSMIVVLRNQIAAPLEGDAARQAARQMMTAYGTQAVMNKEVRELLDHASVTYYGEYSKSAADDSTLSALPSPDSARVQQERYKKGALGGLLFVSSMAAVIALSAGMTALSETVWLPRLWRKQSGKDASAEPDMYAERLCVPPVWRFSMYLLFALLALALFVDVRFMLPLFPAWLLVAIVLGGLVAGAFASRLFNLKGSKEWPNLAYLFVVVLLTAFVVGGALVANLRPLLVA